MGFRKNRLYRLDRPFAIGNNHKPTVSILSKTKTIVPLNIERLILHLQGYDFDIVHISSNKYISDYSSQHSFANPKGNN